MTVESVSTLLTLEKVLELARIRDGHRFAGPSEYPGSLAFSPFRDARVMLDEPIRHIFRDADVEFTLGILNHVDTIHGIRSSNSNSRKKLVAGVGFEPTTFRL